MKNQILVLDGDTYGLRKPREILAREGFNIITVVDKETAFKLNKSIKFSYVLGKASILGFNGIRNN